MDDKNQNKEDLFGPIREMLETATSEEERLAIIKSELAFINDPAIRLKVETLINVWHETSIQPENIVVLIHGIRTRAPWQEKVRGELSDDANTLAFPISYGNYYDIFQFILAKFFEQNQINLICSELRTIRSDYALGEITLIAHSFGTYLISKILMNHPDIKIHRLLLCGSIIPTSYSWNKVPRFPKGGIINDVGTKDYLPVLAQFINKRFGESGTFGFKTSKVKDRYHDFDHSGFFELEFIQRYWLPFIRNGYYIESSWSADRDDPPYFISVANKTSTKIILLTFAASITFTVYYFCF